MGVTLLVKFGSKNHLERMQKDGILHCNTITFFSKLEDNYKRGDKSESVIELKYFENVAFEVKPVNEPSSEWKRLNSKTSQYSKYFKKPMGNLFCMSAFEINLAKESKEYVFNEGFLEFGYALLMTRQDLFMERLRNALDKLEFKSCYNSVNYLDLKKYTGKKNLFQKDNKFSWQEEFRIIIYTQKCEELEPYEFSIGNIEDISEIIDLSKTKSLLYKL